MIKNILDGIITMLALWVWSWIVLWALNALNIVKIKYTLTNALALAILVNSGILIITIVYGGFRCLK